MKVIKEGESWSIQQTCSGIGINGSGCGAILEIEEDDIYAIVKLIDAETPDFLYSQHDYCYTFRCPCCNIETEIKAYLPVDIKRRVLDRMGANVKKLRVSKDGRMYL